MLTSSAGVEVTTTTPPQRATRERLLRLAAIVATGLAAATGGLYVRSAPVDVPELRLQINTPPFWSPDSKSVGFFADQKLKRIDIAGGAVRSLADAPSGFNGATWNGDGVVLFVPANTGPLYRVSADGGNPVAVTRLDAPRQLAHRFPHFLPDGRHFIYWVSGTPEVNGVYVGDLESGSTSRLVEADMLTEFAPPDYVLYVRRETLLAHRLDIRALKLTGAPLPVSERVEPDLTVGLRAAVSASAAGPIAYRTAATVRRQVIQLDRMGRQTGTVGEFDTGSINPVLRVSPDGRWISYTSNETGQIEVYVRPFPGPGPATRISTNGGTAAQWRADQREISYVAPGGRVMAVPITLPAHDQDVEAGTPVALFTIRPDAAFSASPDGQRFFVLTSLDVETTPPITVLLNWAGARGVR